MNSRVSSCCHRRRRASLGACRAGASLAIGIRSARQGRGRGHGHQARMEEARTRRLYVDVKNDKGEIENWNFELPSPNTLMRRGWTRDSLKPGDRVKVAGAPARNFPTIAIANVDQGRQRQAAVHRHDADLRARSGVEGLGLGEQRFAARTEPGERPTPPNVNCVTPPLAGRSSSLTAIAPLEIAPADDGGPAAYRSHRAEAAALASLARSHVVAFPHVAHERRLRRRHRRVLLDRARGARRAGAGEGRAGPACHGPTIRARRQSARREVAWRRAESHRGGRPRSVPTH